MVQGIAQKEPTPMRESAVAPDVHPVVAEIFERQAVRHGDGWIPLHSHFALEDGLFLREVIEATRATRSLEVGMAYGISTLFMCEALTRVGPAPAHVAIDPFQHADWNGIGLANAARAGFGGFVEFHEERSELVLPALLKENRQFDVALIDGWHSFDQALVEFYYISRMLRVGGIVVFDDADWPGIQKLMRYLITLPCYEVYDRRRRSLPTSFLGKVRRRIGDSAFGRRVLHPSFRHPAWEFGIHHRCVALQKVAEDTRDMRWFEDF
jgi:predicted O-methyltransferase YrrM